MSHNFIMILQYNLHKSGSTLTAATDVQFHIHEEFFTKSKNIFRPSFTWRKLTVESEDTTSVIHVQVWSSQKSTDELSTFLHRSSHSVRLGDDLSTSRTHTHKRCMTGLSTECTFFLIAMDNIHFNGFATGSMLKPLTRPTLIDHFRKQSIKLKVGQHNTAFVFDLVNLNSYDLSPSKRNIEITTLTPQ